MILIVVILLVAYVIIPLLDLTLKENVRFFGKVFVYVATFVYVIWQLYIVGNTAV